MPDTLLIAPGTDPDQFYATGLDLHGTLITLVRGRKRIVAAGGFEFPQVQRRYPSAMRFEELGKTFPDVIRAFLKKNAVKKPVMPASTAARFFRLVPGATLQETVFPARSVKKKEETAKIRLVQQATEAAISAVRDTLALAKVTGGKATLHGKPLTSEYLKTIASVILAQHNCSCPDMIISSGRQGALPHHTGAGVIREGAVVVDVFPKSNLTHYYADCTRTFVVGEAPKTFDERYQAVLEVHRRARRHVRHGARDTEKIARNTFEELGFKTNFSKGAGYIHSLGHGVGLEIHEQPRLKEQLVAGNVITIEPGLYYDYGIRVEDIGLVTKTGFANFTKLPKEPYLS